MVDHGHIGTENIESVGNEEDEVEEETSELERPKGTPILRWLYPKHGGYGGKDATPRPPLTVPQRGFL